MSKELDIVMVVREGQMQYDYYFASVQGAENMQSGSYLSMGGSTGNWNPVSYLSAGQIISTYYWGAATTYKLEGTLILSVIRFRQY